MSSDPAGVRRILPQSAQMQSFAFVPNSFGSREPQKNYVFVDEHNRHKRLKVMRACEGCRRRKIKCDAATTNTWPCSACIRLKLHCIPPTVNYDGAGGHGFEQERVEYESGSGDDDYHNNLPLQHHLQTAQKNSQQNYTQQIPYQDHSNNYQPMTYAPPSAEHQTMQFASLNGSAIMDGQFQTQSAFPMPPMQQSIQPQDQPHSSPSIYQGDSYGAQDLADYLGDLRMDESGTAPYLNRKKSAALEEPVFEEPDTYAMSLPAVTSSGMKIRIPPELMPDEETALHYFDIYFTNVHPYVPVLNKALFYHQWQNNRESISPLILEAIFAIAGRLADEPSQGQQWLALASRHVDAFMDVARLSTLQAMLIVLKARESAPKRGYYYRSWMTVVQCIAMARDLGLDEHYDDHKAGRPCGNSPHECLTKTRVWQVVFAVELMVGSPQGRTDLSVDPNSVDFSLPRALPGDEAEYHISRHFTYFARCIALIRKMSDVYSRLKKKSKEWGMDPEFVQLNPSFGSWMADLPADLQISFPSDGSPPWLPSHLIGNLHTHYHLGVIMLHRPQLALMDPSGLDGKWKHHMMICYNNAKMLCRLQEAILNTFGVTGYLSMQRGINFTIYCILTCTVIHLVALTSPDPDLNKDAREYFTRHMQLLEKCTSSWPMPDMQHQIDALREAFSADMSKPFELKPSFPYGSPSTVHHSPPHSINYPQPQLGRTSSMDMQHQSLDARQGQQQQQLNYAGQPITPPISASGVTSKSDSPAVQSLVMMATGQRLPQQQAVTNAVPLVDPSTWNPSRIFEQWNTTFGAASIHAAPQQQHSSIRHASTSSQDVASLPDMQGTGTLPLPLGSQGVSSQQYSAAPMPSFVSPSMWQESVASVYEGGLKRQWDYDNNNMVNQAMKRR